MVTIKMYGKSYSLKFKYIILKCLVDLPCIILSIFSNKKTRPLLNFYSL